MKKPSEERDTVIKFWEHGDIMKKPFPFILKIWQETRMAFEGWFGSRLGEIQAGQKRFKRETSTIWSLLPSTFSSSKPCIIFEQTSGEEYQIDNLEWFTWMDSISCGTDDFSLFQEDKLWKNIAAVALLIGDEDKNKNRKSELIGRRPSCNFYDWIWRCQQNMHPLHQPLSNSIQPAFWFSSAGQPWSMI